jgi:hypothetical protein
VQRHIIGVLAAAFLMGAVVIRFSPLGEIYAADIGGFLLRLGLIFGLWWLALPALSRLPGWLVITVLVSAVVLVVRPKFWLLCVPLVIVLAILKPRWGAKR